MKKILGALFTRMITAILCVSVVVGCNNKSGSGSGSGASLPSGMASAEKNSFKEVTSKLDAGGNFFLYLSTEQFLDGCAKTVSGWRNYFTSIRELDSDSRAAIDKVFDIVSNLIKDSGVEDISGFGMSSIATEPGFYYGKSYLHHYPGKGNGFLWKLFGEKSHPLKGLDMLPSTTALAIFSDADVPLLWSVIKDQVRHAGFPQAESMLNRLPETFEMGTGLKWEKVLGSLGGEFGFVLTLDDSKKVSIPMPRGDSMDFPEPGLILVAKVKDDTIFNRIDQAMSQTMRGGPPVERVDNSDLKMRTVAVPLPLPISLRPTIATSDGYLFLALNDASIQEMLAAKSGKSAGLKSTDEFKRLSKNVPLEGNQFTFFSQRFGKVLIDIRHQMAKIQGEHSAQSALQEWIQSIIDPKQTGGFSFTVTGNTDEGWLTVANGDQSPAKLLAIVPMIFVGLLAAIAIPNFARARHVASSNGCINNLRQIDGAKAQWALENNKKSSDIPSWDQIQPYLGRGNMVASQLSCPQGGVYTIGSVGDPPRCSVPGHTL